MKKVAFFFMLLLLALSAAMAVFTYFGAAVKNRAEIKIVATNEALLGLMGPEDEGCIKYCTINSGSLILNFTSPGFTPDSIYEFDILFWVKNNSADTILFTVRNEGVPYIKKVKPHEADCSFIENGIQENYRHRLEPGSSAGITVCFDTDSAVNSSCMGGTLQVSAEAAY